MQALAPPAAGVNAADSTPSKLTAGWHEYAQKMRTLGIGTSYFRRKKQHRDDYYVSVRLSASDLEVMHDHCRRYSTSIPEMFQDWIDEHVAYLAALQEDS